MQPELKDDSVRDAFVFVVQTFAGLEGSDRRMKERFAVSSWLFGTNRLLDVLVLRCVEEGRL